MVERKGVEWRRGRCHLPLAHILEALVAHGDLTLHHLDERIGLQADTVICVWRRLDVRRPGTDERVRELVSRGGK